MKPFRALLGMPALMIMATPVLAQNDCACVIPRTSAVQSVGQISGGLGQVEATDEAGALGQAGSGQPLYLGSRVVTGPDGSAEITIFGTTEPPSTGCSLAMNANSELTIFATDENICVQVLQSEPAPNTASEKGVPGEAVAVIGGIAVGVGVAVGVGGGDDGMSN